MPGVPTQTGQTDAALLTLDEYERLPDEDGYRLELSAGRLVREPPPGARQGVIVRDLFRALDTFVSDHELGEVVFETGFLLVERPPTVRGPDLAVEVVSPSNAAAEMQEKVLQYLETGTRLVWVVQPRTRTVETRAPGPEVRILREDEFLEGGEVVPGFRIAAGELFGAIQSD